MSVNPVDSKIWGGWFGSDEMRELFSDRAQVQFMLDVEAALARAQAGLGMIPAEIAPAITACARVERIDLDAIAAGTRRAGYPVVALVAELGRAAGAEAARHIHMGATTQDILDAALVLQMRAAIAIVRRGVLAVARALADQARRFRDTPMAARTHLQQAVPTTFGFKCALWAAPLVNHVERIDQAAARALTVQLGGAAGTLSAMDGRGVAVMEALAGELKLRAPGAPWHTARDGVAEMASVLALICGSLAKFALDILLLAQTEVAEVAEPYADGRGGSSAMPQKRNPIASEYVIAAARGVNATVPVMFAAMAQEHERAAGGWQSEALALPQCFALTAGALEHARAIAEGMRVDAARMRRNLDAAGGLVMAEAAASALGAKIGRAAAHAAVERVCADAIARGRTLGEALRDDAAIAKHLDSTEIERALDPTLHLGAAGEFVDRVAARIAALR